MFLLRVVALVSLLSAAKAACTFPVPNPDNSCAIYDLSPFSSPQGTSVAASPYNYIINVCDDASLPLPACAGKSSAPGYQLQASDASLCVKLGQLNSTYYNTVPGDSNGAGIKVMYYNGDSVSVDAPRSFVISFICDASVGHGAPQFLYQDGDRYEFEWRSASACPVSQDPTPCPIAYDANWNSLALRPLPTWFDKAKFGIFLHWGLYSVPAFKSEWYPHQLNGGTWGSTHANPDPSFVDFHNRVYGCSGVEPDKYPCTGPEFSYADFTPMFQAELFDPDAWASLFKKAGAKYVVLTSKHHEGYCLWPSKEHWNWNSVDTGPHRDLVGNLTASVRAAGLIMGVYHSLREWYHPLYLQDNDNNCATTSFVDEILLPTLRDLSERYQPDVFWADGAGDAPCTHDSVEYWKAPEFISWLYNHAANNKTVIVNSRWGTGSGGDYMTGSDRFTPGHLLPQKWESCFTVQAHSWGYDRTEDISSYYDATGLLNQLVETVSCGGNLLLNVGPTADGRIMPAFEERLLQMGEWLGVNGEAIYSSHPWRAQNDTAAKDLWYTLGADGTTVYAITFSWPSSNVLMLTQPRAGTGTLSANLLGFGPIGARFQQGAGSLLLTLPDVTPLSPVATWAAKAWVIALTGVA